MGIARPKGNLSNIQMVKPTLITLVRGHAQAPSLSKTKIQRCSTSLSCPPTSSERQTKNGTKSWKSVSVLAKARHCTYADFSALRLPHKQGLDISADSLDTRAFAIVAIAIAKNISNKVRGGRSYGDCHQTKRCGKFGEGGETHFRC